MTAIKIHVLLLDGVLDSGLASLMEAFGSANALAASVGQPALRWELRRVGLRAQPRSAQGLGLPVTPAADLPAPDLVLLPGLGLPAAEDLPALLQRDDVADARWQLLQWAGAGSRLGTACSGSFVLAGTGLLDGAPATTSWWLAPAFRARFPAVRLDESRMVVDAGPCLTAAAAGPGHLDLALWMIRERSPALAAAVARQHLAASRPTQTGFALPDPPRPADPLVAAFERWARARLDRGFDLAEAAAACGSSPRTLNRRLHALLGRSPLAAFQDLRVQHALARLAQAGIAAEQVAAEVGYADPTTLRKLLRQRLGRGLQELRRQAGDGAPGPAPATPTPPNADPPDRAG